MSGIEVRGSVRPAAASGQGNSEAPAGAGAVLPPAGSGPHHRWLRASPDAGAAARREVEDVAAGVEDDVVERSRLLATELVTNCVRHAGLGPEQGIELNISVLADRVRIEVADEGGGFELPSDQPDPRPATGWGLWLVDQLADRWGIEPGPGARVWCELDRNGGQERAAATDARWSQRRPSPSVVASFLARQEAAASYRRAQRRALRDGVERDGARPLEFDESGFPIPQRNQGFVDRIARLLKT
jgi:anti-sigma regulatory factor (Ser/Thr protein kinase)